MAKDELDPLNLPMPARQQKNMNLKAAFSSGSVWMSAIFTLITIVSAILFSIFSSKAIAGFCKQINSFVQIGDLGASYIQILVFIFVLLFIAYLFLVQLATSSVFTNCLSCCGTTCMLFFTSLGSQIFLIGWVVVICIISSLTLVYFIFIGSIYSFCAVLNSNTCLNFKVLLPAIASKISNNKVDLTFCEEKRQLLCDRENNMIWNFGMAFLMAMVTFCGILMVQNCLVYSYGKKKRKTPKNDHYEMDKMHQ